MIDLNNYIDNLLKIFDQLDEQVGYFKIDPTNNSAKYIQQSISGTKIITLNSIYYDFVESGFIKYSTIKKNKEILSKLLNYKDSLVLLYKYKYGYEVKVYNIIGELIYHQYIKFFDKTRWYQKLYLTKKYPELVLQD